MRPLILHRRLVLVGTSAGGLEALQRFVSLLPADFPAPVVIVQHLSPVHPSYLVPLLATRTSLPVREIDDKMALDSAKIYCAPVNYHVLIESNWTLALSNEPEVNYSRPSIDVLFESAAIALGPSVLGIVMTGANQDGAQGLSAIKRAGGTVMVQRPDTAEYSFMPHSALKEVVSDFTGTVEEIVEKVRQEIQSISNPRSGTSS